MYIDTDSDVLSQAQFADLIGVDPSRVSQLATAGAMPERLTLRAGLAAYIGRLREQAAGRLGDDGGGLSLTQERAALARAQRLLAEQRLAINAGEYAPISTLAQVLASASQAVSERFEHLPARLRKRCQALPADAIDELQCVIAEARNEWVQQTAELVTAAILADDDSIEDAADGAEGEADGNPD